MPEIRIGGNGVGQYAAGSVVNVSDEEAAILVKDNVAAYTSALDVVPPAPAAEPAPEGEEFVSTPPAGDGESLSDAELEKLTAPNGEFESPPPAGDFDFDAPPAGGQSSEEEKSDDAFKN